MSSSTMHTSRTRWLALAVLATGMLMIILDGSIVTVAIPSIQRDLGFSPAGLSWVVNAYLISFGSLLLLVGRLGDLVGRKRMLLAGTAVFTVASLLAGVSTGPAMLITARFLQGIGSALASAVSLGILVTMLPADRGIGLTAGADVLGALLVTGGLMLGIFTIVGVERAGWTSARTLGLGALAIALLVGFFIRQATARTPLMPLRILRSRNVSGANLVQMLMIGAMFSFQILVALFMQKVLGYTALQTGLAMLPAAALIGAVSLGVSARLMSRFGERAVLLTGLIMLVGVLGLLIRVPVHAGYVRDLLPVMLLVAGGGLALPAATALGMSGAKSDDAGLASGLFNTTQQIGMAIGVAVLSTLAATRTDRLLAHGHSAPDALTSGYRLAFTVSAGLLIVAIAVAVVVLRRPQCD